MGVLTLLSFAGFTGQKNQNFSSLERKLGGVEICFVKSTRYIYFIDKKFPNGLLCCKKPNVFALFVGICRRSRLTAQSLPRAPLSQCAARPLPAWR
jgi:hypothetical protein